MMKFFILTTFITNVMAIFSTFNGQLTFNNQEIFLRGINWYGMETPNIVMEGLWQYPIDSYLDLLVNHSFNYLNSLSLELLNYY